MLVLSVLFTLFEVRTGVGGFTLVAIVVGLLEAWVLYATGDIRLSSEEYCSVVDAIMIFFEKKTSALIIRYCLVGISCVSDLCSCCALLDKRAGYNVTVPSHKWVFMAQNRCDSYFGWLLKFRQPLSFYTIVEISLPL